LGGDWERGSLNCSPKGKKKFRPRKGVHPQFKKVGNPPGVGSEKLKNNIEG